MLEDAVTSWSMYEDYKGLLQIQFKMIVPTRAIWKVQ